MKKLFKFLLIAIALILGIIILFAAFIHIKGVPQYPYSPTPAIASLKVVSDSQRIARGLKISQLLCTECHKDFKTGNMTGHLMTDMPKEFGKIASLNITQDKNFGIGDWTDGELYYYLRTAVRKDGHYNPIMGGYNLMADEEIMSIIAWLRSDHKTLTPSQDEAQPNDFNFLIIFLCNTVFKPKELPKSPIIIPDSTDQIAFGKYMANSLTACYGCHSADFKTMDTNIPEKSAGFYGGGNPMLDYDGKTVKSANITMDPNFGIGKWTVDQFVQAVRFNKKPDGSPLHYPMFPHTSLTDYEVQSIWEYLKTIPILPNKVERFKEE